MVGEGGSLAAAVAGPVSEEELKKIASGGATRIFYADAPDLALYSSDLYADFVGAAAERCDASVILMGATAMGKDLGPTLAARLKSPIATDCVALSMEGEHLVATRPVYGGKAWATVKSRVSVRQIATLRPNVFAPSPPREATAAVVEKIALDRGDPERPRAVVKEVRATTGSKVELTEASMIVSGGRGLKGPENFKIIEDLAEALGAAVGASRAAVDAGWKPHSYQVGLTGKTVSPLLYIACGISGAIQHQAGMSSSKYIVAINKDPNAPIFKLATYGVVGDLFELVPLLTQEIRRVKSE